MFNIKNNMLIAFDKLNISQDDPNIEKLAYDLIDIYLRSPNSKNMVNDSLKERIIEFLLNYGFPENEYLIITLDLKITNRIKKVAKNITTRCNQVGITPKDCVADQFNILYPLLPSIYTNIIKNSTLFDEIVNIRKLNNNIDNNLRNLAQLLPSVHNFRIQNLKFL